MTKRKDGSGGIYHYVLILGLLAAAYGRFGTTNASNDTGFWWGFLVLNIVGLQMSCFGHLNPKIAAKIREGQGWGHSLGVKVLQTELALLQLCVLIASLYAQVQFYSENVPTTKLHSLNTPTRNLLT